ncbi:N-acetylneuraminate synthase family protein [Janibacter sp. GXQ6167]|uniref:N-acetylneuraminate synthase family protein n=1 Tax=Janibacter sp. GXQ6167 TaxID=3240791 RepID=UPI0035239598
MNIDRNLTPFVVYSGDSVLAALHKITANHARIVFCLDEHGLLQGALSDGDFRRWVSEQADVDLTVSVGSIANREVTSAAFGASPEEIAPLFRRGIDRIPLVDERGHLVAIATDRSAELRIGGRVIGADEPAYLIAEIGINHNGSIDLAKQLVDLAAEAGADCVKFQMRDMEALYRQGGGGASAGEDLGPQYTLDLLSKMSLTNDELFEVFDHAGQHDLAVMCTAWDTPSVRALVDYGVPALKIASADLTNHALLREAGSHGVPLIASTGMATEGEIRESAEVIRRTGAPFALLHCQSTYPAPFKDVNLQYMARLAEIGQCPVGYSGHERGYHVPLAAIALGASVIEKHFTIDRGMEGNDHKVSLLPHEFAAMVRQTRELEESLGTDEPREVSTGEMMNRVNLAKSLVATRRIETGEVLTDADIEIKSPGRGLQPNKLGELVGRTMRRPIDAGDFFYATDLSDAVARGRQYEFRRPWGLPVRYHDYPSLIEDATPDFLEFHFSYKDLEIDPATVLAGLDEPLPMHYACHSPDLFSGDFLLNLASDDDAHWERSIAELQRVVDITRSMGQWFTTPTGRDGAPLDPVVICSLGGFTSDAFAPADELDDMYARVAAGLDRVDLAGVRMCAQTLPPYPWYMGGQLYCNLFVGADDTAAWAQRYNRRLCLDLSHSKLAANHRGMPFSQAVELLAPHTDHLHIVDATGVDGEGVQVGDGEIDWAIAAEQLDRLAPGVGFIPEIWQGHVNNGEGFWTALDRLEAWF